MTAVFQFSQTYGTTPGTAVDIGDGGGGNYWNYKNADDATPANYSTYPITAAARSYGVYVRGHFTSSFISISNIKFWASTLTLTGYGTGALISGSEQSSYGTPSTADTGDANIPTTEGTALGPTYSSNYSQYLRTQLETAADATPGDGGVSTFTMKYDET